MFRAPCCPRCNGTAAGGVVCTQDPRCLLPLARTGRYAPLQDAQRALGIVRQNAAKWGINASMVGFTGSSAGGHLTGVSCRDQLVPVSMSLVSSRVAADSHPPTPPARCTARQATYRMRGKRAPTSAWTRRMIYRAARISPSSCMLPPCTRPRAKQTRDDMAWAQGDGWASSLSQERQSW